jgi:cleavage and polyadenylation specificity factor subunit 1
MQCYTELVPPTAVSHAISLPFLSPSTNSLVVARTSLLQIYSLKSIQSELDTDRGEGASPSTRYAGQIVDRRILENDELDSSFLDADAAVQKAERAVTAKLVLVAEYQLHGTVSSLARVKIRNSKSGADALLVAFRDAKLSLVEWDPERHGISTISIHYYEHEDLERSPWAPELHRCVNYLTVDPRGKCAILKFGNRSLAILPFRQPGDDLVMEDYDHDADGQQNFDTPMRGANNEDAPPAQMPYSSSFVLPVTGLDPSLVHLVHLAFLYEYRGPTCGILGCAVAPSISRLSEHQDVLAYTVVTLDLEQRASTTILSVTGLPYDLYEVVPLPYPVGGSLLVGANELVHIDQAGKTNGVAVNAFARECTSFSMSDQSDLAMKLEHCKIEPLGTNSSDMLLVLRTGELAVVEFKLDGRAVSGLSVNRMVPKLGGVVLSGAASCTSLLTRGKMFIGSEEGDSVVLGWSRHSAQQMRHSELVQDHIMEDVADQDAIDDYDDDLYSGDGNVDHDRDTANAPVKANLGNEASGDLVFRLHDALFSIAPVTDITFGYAAANVSHNERHQLEMVVTSGHRRAGGVTALRRELDADVVSRPDLSGVQGVWSVLAKRPVSKALAAQQPTKAAAQLNGGYPTDLEHDRFLIVSKSDTEGDTGLSSIYSLKSSDLTELTDTEFEPAAGETVDVGVLGNGTRIVQVLQSEIRSYDGGMFSLFESAFLSVFATALFCIFLQIVGGFLCRQQWSEAVALSRWTRLCRRPLPFCVPYHGAHIYAIAERFIHPVSMARIASKLVTCHIVKYIQLPMRPILFFSCIRQSVVTRAWQ